jgi:hypothetical protein
MAKMFYSATEASDRLGRTEEQLKALVREGKLREFRDAGTINYKVTDVDALVEPIAADTATDDSSSASASGDIVLEPVEDSSVELAASGGDVVSLEASAAGATASGTTAVGKVKEDTVVPSVGVNVFDDDELDEQVDPLAQTAITDVAGLGMEGVGSGSGILELTRESDDTSLGKELLDEIYTDEGKGAEEGTVEMGDDTRAGLAEALPEEAVDEEEIEVGAEAEPVARQPRAAVREVVEYGPDAVSTSLTALMIVAVAVMWFAGLGAAALVRGITPAPLQAVYENLWIYAGAAMVAAVVAGGVTFLVVKKRSG